MDLAREQFVEHFAIAYDVHCLRKWPKRGRKSAPTWLSSYLYKWTLTNNGQIDVDGPRFADIIDPLIEELHRTIPTGEGLDRKTVTGLIYDRLDAAGVTVRIGPPLAGHSA